MDKTLLDKLTIAPVLMLVVGLVSLELLQDWVVFVPSSPPVIYTMTAAVIVVSCGRWSLYKDDLFSSLVTSILNLLMAVSLLGNLTRFISLRNHCSDFSHVAPEFCSQLSIFFPASLTFIILALVPTFLAYAYASFLFFRNFQTLRLLTPLQEEELPAAVVGVPVSKV